MREKANEMKPVLHLCVGVFVESSLCLFFFFFFHFFVPRDGRERRRLMRSVLFPTGSDIHPSASQLLECVSRVEPSRQKYSADINTRLVSQILDLSDLIRLAICVRR